MIRNIDWVGIYAAVVASMALGWRIYEWLRNRPQIKIKVQFLHKFDAPGVDYEKTFISVTAMNTGHYPTTMSTSGFRCSDKMDIQNVLAFRAGQLPCRLNEGQSSYVEYDPEDLKKALRKQGEGVRIKFAWYRDQADRLYKGRFPKNIKALLN